MRSKALAILALLSLLAAFPTLAADIYLVRHAEKVTDESKDPELTAVGMARAKNLATMLRSADIERIFSSDYKRTRDTAAPLASDLGLDLEIYDPRALELFAEALLEIEKNSLVVGHSNTTPELVDLMGGKGGAPIVEEWEYDRLYLLQTENRRVVRTTLLHVSPATFPPQ